LVRLAQVQTHHAGAVTSAPPTVSDYLNDVGHLAATFQTMPGGDGGRRLKRALLNALEDSLSRRDILGPSTTRRFIAAFFPASCSRSQFFIIPPLAVRHSRLLSCAP